MEKDLIYNILYFGGIGSLAFFLLLCLMAYTGIFEAVRDEEGNFKKELNWESVTGFGIFILLFFTLLHLGNRQLIQTLGEHPGMKLLRVNAFGIFMVVHLFDLIVLDYLIVVKWHPKFLNLPDTAYYTSMKPHFEGFFRGLFFGFAMSMIVTLFS